MRAIKAAAALLSCVVILYANGYSHGQNGRWPAQGGAEPSVLRAYGTGTMVPAMRKAARCFGQEKGILVNIVSGPVQSWRARAIRDADLIFTDSEYSMTSLARRDLPAVVDTATVRTLSLEGSSIRVRNGNPKGIRGLKDLAAPGIRILIGDGPEQESAWQETARRMGFDSLIEKISGNIAKKAGSTGEAQSVWTDDPGLDAWLVILPGQTQEPGVITRKENSIYRACVIAFTRRSAKRALAQEFVDFIESARGQAIFSKYGGGPVDQ